MQWESCSMQYAWAVVSMQWAICSEHHAVCSMLVHWTPQYCLLAQEATVPSTEDKTRSDLLECGEGLLQGEGLIGCVNLASYSNSSCLSFPSSDMVVRLVVFTCMMDVGVEREHNQTLTWPMRRGVNVCITVYILIIVAWGRRELLG